MISHIKSERSEPGPYKWCRLLTCCTRFGAMRGCQEQNREVDLGGSPGNGWTGDSKRTIYSMLGQAVIIFHSEMYQNNIFLFFKNYF